MDRDEYFTPDELTTYLRDQYRLQRGKRRLAEMRATGEGPPFFRAGGCQVLYRRDLADTWARAVIGEPLKSTADESSRRRLGRVNAASGRRLPAHA
jgi:hypothetical protein